MPLAIVALRELLSSAQASISRPSALAPIQWVIAILIGGLVLAIHYSAAPWVLVLLAASVGVCLLAFLVAYFWFMAKSPDALRSERFNISKMAIERGLMGDNLAGLLSEQPTGKNLLASSTEKRGG